MRLVKQTKLIATYKPIGYPFAPKEVARIDFRRDRLEVWLGNPLPDFIEVRIGASPML